MSKRIILTILLCGGLYLIGNGRVSLWDRDEPRYAQASRQMLQSGDWVVPKLLDEPRIKKPPMIYWCQATAMAVFQRVSPDSGLSPMERMDRDAAAARLPSSIAIVLTLLLIALVLRPIVDEEQTFWTVLVFGTSGLVIMSAKMCLTDGVLLLFVTGSQFCLYAMYRRRGGWGVIVGFAVSTGLGLLTKGPVVLGINLTTLVVLGILKVVDAWKVERPPKRGFEVVVGNRSTGILPVPESVDEEEKSGLDSVAVTHGLEARVTRGVVMTQIIVALFIVIAICLPWVYLVWQRLKEEAAKGGVAVDLWSVFYNEVIKRMTTPLEQHKGPPGYYLLFFFASFFPWCLLLPTAVKLAWQARREPLIRFAFAAVVGPWIMFECIATKLPHYVLPCFPFLAILAAAAIVRGIRSEHREWNQRGWLIAVGVWSAVVIALGAMPWVAALPRYGFDRMPYLAMGVVSVAAIFFAARVFIDFAHQRIAAAAYSIAIAMVVLIGLLFQFYLPGARFLHLSEEVGAYLQSVGATNLRDVYMIDYKEDSLPFYQGGTIRPQPWNVYLSKVPFANWPGFFVITREIWDATPESARGHLEVMKTFHGLAYAAKGRVVDVLVVRKRVGPSAALGKPSG